MADQQSDNRSRRRFPDVLTLLVGLASLVVTSYVVTDGELWLPAIDPRWLLSGGGVLVGLLMLAGSVGFGRRKR